MEGSLPKTTTEQTKEPKRRSIPPQTNLSAAGEAVAGRPIARRNETSCRSSDGTGAMCIIFGATVWSQIFS